MGKCIMKLENITKRFFGNEVLKKVDFEVYEGKVHALIGGNGAGKSTLMKILTGVYTRDEGTIYFDGKPVEFKSYKDAAQHGVAMIFQEMSGVLTLTVTENIFLNNEILKNRFALDKAAMRKKAMEMLNLLGVDIDPDTPIGRLTVGERQMVEIVKALTHEARILVMDEPTASLSTSEVERLFEIIENLKQKGIAIIYISHRMNEIVEITDSVTVLRDGEKVAELENEDLSVETMITHMMGEKTSKSFEWHPPKLEHFTEKLLEVKNLKVNDWIENISFTLYKGEVVGFAGLLSSGRTEVLETIFGLRKMLDGSIEVEGKPVKINSVQDAIKAGFGLVPEDRRTQGLVLMHSVKQNLTLPNLKKLKNGIFLNQKKMNQVTNESVKELAIKTDSIDKLIRLLSGGNQQKVVIAKWLRSDMRIMLLDEPTVGVDVGAKKELVKIVRDFANNGNGAVFVSSEIAELMSVCDRVFILKKGKIVSVLSHKEIESEEVLQNAVQQ